MDKLRDCLKTASASIKHLCRELETALERADQVAQEEMLSLLKRQKDPSVTIETDFAITETSQVPFVESNLGDQGQTLQFETSTAESKAMEQATADAEEAYRQQALDYSLGHVASAVREDDRPSGTGKDLKSSSLFHRLLNAAGAMPAQNESNEQVLVSMNTDGKISDPEPNNMETEDAPKPVVDEPNSKETSKPKDEEMSDDDEEEETTFALSLEFQKVREAKKS